MTQFFKLDTRDNTFQAQEMYAAYLNHKAVVFTVSTDGVASVSYVLDLKRPDQLRAAVQEIIDVVGFSESGRPTIVRIQPGAFSAQALFLAEALEL